MISAGIVINGNSHFRLLAETVCQIHFKVDGSVPLIGGSLPHLLKWSHSIDMNLFVLFGGGSL